MFISIFQGWGRPFDAAKIFEAFNIVTKSYQHIFKKFHLNFTIHVYIFFSWPHWGYTYIMGSAQWEYGYLCKCLYIPVVTCWTNLDEHMIINIFTCYSWDPFNSHLIIRGRGTMQLRWLFWLCKHFFLNFITHKICTNSKLHFSRKDGINLFSAKAGNYTKNI